MTAEVKHLSPVTQPVREVDAEAVDILRTLLAGAERGEFNGVVVVTLELVGAGQCIGVGSVYGGQGVRQSIHAALGGVEVVKGRLLKQEIEW